MALVSVRRAYFQAPSRRRVFVELPPQGYQAGNEHMCGLLRHILRDTRDAARKWEEERAATLSKLKLTRGIACTCVWPGASQRRTRRGNSGPGMTSSSVENDQPWNASST